MFKKFSIWLIKNLMIILVATLIFSNASFDFPDVMKGTFGDVYDFASPEAQREAVGRLAETCASMESGSNVITMQQLCSNDSVMQSVIDNCNEYKKMKRQGAQIENEQQMEESCAKIESGEIEDECNQLKSGQNKMDLSRIGAVCNDYKAGKINDKEFFYSVIGGSLGNFVSGQQSDSTKMNLFDKYNKFIDFLNKDRIIYLVLLAILAALLYFILHDYMAFCEILSDIAFGIGMLIMLPYVLILLYAKYVGIDTTSILGSLLGLGNIFDFKAIISVILLLFLRTYNNFILTVGIVFLIAGGIGKIYSMTIKKRMRHEETKKIEENDKKYDNEKESMTEEKTESSKKPNKKNKNNNLKFH